MSYAKIKQLIIFSEERIANALFYWLNKSFFAQLNIGGNKLLMA
jgi:hypothetical protein